MTLINTKMQENKNFIYQFKKSLDEFKNSKIKGKLPDLSFSKLCAKIKNKKLLQRELIAIYEDYINFLLNAKTPNIKEYFGKFSPKVINLCFEHYQEIFDIDYFEMIENYKKSEIMNDIYESWKIKKTDMKPEYMRFLIPHIKRPKESDFINQEAFPFYKHEYGQTTEPEPKQ